MKNGANVLTVRSDMTDRLMKNMWDCSEISGVEAHFLCAFGGGQWNCR